MQKLMSFCLTKQKVQLKIKIVKKKQYSLFPLMGSSGRVETKQKQNGNISQHINRVSPLPHWKLCSGRIIGIDFTPMGFIN